MASSARYATRAKQRARPALASGTRCAECSKQRARPAWPAGRSACAAAGRNAVEASRKLRAGFGMFSGQAAVVGLASASEIGGNSEQWLGVFVLVAAGEEEERKNVILGFHSFYHGGPYSFIFF